MKFLYAIIAAAVLSGCGQLNNALIIRGAQTFDRVDNVDVKVLKNDGQAYAICYEPDKSVRKDTDVKCFNLLVK